MHKKHFTLVELMIVVAIIGILAAIAIPNFYAMQLKAKRSEGPVCVDGIQTALVSYAASYNDCCPPGQRQWKPDASPDKDLRSFTSGTAFDGIGWSPDGLVRGSYSFGVDGDDFGDNGNSGTNTNMVCPGTTGQLCSGVYMDVDGDGTYAAYAVGSISGLWAEFASVY